MSDENKDIVDATKTPDKKRNGVSIISILIVVSLAFSTASLVSTFGGNNSSELEHKVAVLQNQTNIDNQYISLLINKTIAHENFNQQVVQWAQQEDNRTAILEAKIKQHFGS